MVGDAVTGAVGGVGLRCRNTGLTKSSSNYHDQLLDSFNMGGGDLNMKKSWHPLLMKNQERVWLEEKKALEEKKKLDQLRKEKEEERQLQELQRLQEEQTGKKRADKLEWMYTTPATGNSQNANELEDYLLGKKRVDKMLTADENEKVNHDVISV